MCPYEQIAVNGHKQRLLQCSFRHSLLVDHRMLRALSLGGLRGATRFPPSPLSRSPYAKEAKEKESDGIETSFTSSSLSSSSSFSSSLLIPLLN